MKDFVRLDESCDNLSRDVIQCISSLNDCPCESIFNQDILKKRSKEPLLDVEKNFIAQISYTEVSKIRTRSDYKDFCLSYIKKSNISDELSKVLSLKNSLYLKIIYAEPEWRSKEIKEKYLSMDNYRNMLKWSDKKIKRKYSFYCPYTKDLFSYLYEDFCVTNVFKSVYLKSDNLKEKYKIELLKKKKTCPYCGFELLKEIGMELDHVVPISKNPLYGFTSYNLIGSCHDCNSVHKKSKALFPMLSPIFDDIRQFFYFKLDSNSEEIKLIPMKKNFNELTKNYKNTFGLEARINKDYKEEIIDGYYRYYSEFKIGTSEERLNDLINFFNDDRPFFNVLNDLFKELEQDATADEEMLAIYFNFIENNGN